MENKREWSANDLRLLQQGVTAGHSINDLAAALSMSPTKIWEKLEELRLIPQKGNDVR
jgi:biotin operon repressor